MKLLATRDNPSPRVEVLLHSTPEQWERSAVMMMQMATLHGVWRKVEIATSVQDGREIIAVFQEES